MDIFSSFPGYVWGKWHLKFYIFNNQPCGSISSSLLRNCNSPLIFSLASNSSSKSFTHFATELNSLILLSSINRSILLEVSILNNSYECPLNILYHLPKYPNFCKGENKHLSFPQSMLALRYLEEQESTNKRSYQTVTKHHQFKGTKILKCNIYIIYDRIIESH